MADIDMVRRTLEVFCMPGQVVELRCLNAWGRAAVCTAFRDLDAMARLAVQADEAGASGVYFTPNPLRPDYPLGEQPHGCRKEDVLERHWLLIDCDPRHPTGTNASERERQAAGSVWTACQRLLKHVGMRNVVQADSGNGLHLAVPILLPHDGAAQDLLRELLRALDAKCGDPLTDMEKVKLKARQFLEPPRAFVDTSCHDAPRIWKLYGTTARKGPHSEERPHRVSQLLEDVEPWNEATARHNTGLLPAALKAALETYEDLDRFGGQYRPTSGQASAELAYCREGLKRECQKVAAAVVGSRNDQLTRSSFAVGQLVGPDRLTYDEAFNSLYLAALDAGCDNPKKDKGTLARGLAAGMKEPRQITPLELQPRQPQPQPATVRPNADNSSDPLDADATAADLIRANTTIRWGWSSWLQHGVLNVLASEPGIGKTRFCADLARRVYHGLQWPDGANPSFHPGSCTLWVPADNQHAELATLAQEFGFPPEVLFLNATRRNPFAGTMLDAPEDLRDFEARIRRVQPTLVFVDTSLNATDKSAHKPEDAKAFFVPLQQIAVRTGVVMVMVTHLNMAGKPLGRRIMGQARLVLQLDKPDPTQEHRRKVHVIKSNSLYPAPLGITMEARGNEYDTNPPTAPVSEPFRKGPVPEKLETVKAWLETTLNGEAKRVSTIRTLAEEQEFKTGTLYRAKDALGIEEFLLEGKKWWRFTTD